MRHWRLISTAVAVAAVTAVVSSQTRSGNAVFEQALAKERVEGNVPEAIRLYEKVVAEFAADRPLAAKALLQVGLCYEKLGQDESVRAYERLVRDFADQADAVSQARARLAVLKQAVSGAARAATMPSLRALPRIDQFNALQSLSPDGSKAAVIRYGKGMNLAIYDLAGQQTKLLTDFDWTGNCVYFAAWSPDNRRIAYMQGGCGPDAVQELRVATLDGKSDLVFRNEANPGKNVAPAGWLPDGSALVAMLQRADNTGVIGVVPTAGGSFTPLRPVKSTGAELPSLSPDGRLIAFSEGAPGSREIHVISRDGRTAHRITDHPADDYRPLWAPDGHHLAFLSNRNGSTGLWIVAIRHGDPAGEPLRASEGMQDVHLLGWTKSGLLYTRFVRTEDIYLMPIDRTSGTPAGSPRQIPFPRTGSNITPSWSPDGKYLAFVSGSPAEADRRTVVLLPDGGGEPREFLIPTSQYSAARAPFDLRWFGNSAGLGFSGRDAKGAAVLFRLTLPTGEWKTFPLQGKLAIATWTRIEWNADGSRYYYARRGFEGVDPAIVEHDLESGRERIVYKGTAPNEIFWSLLFSPDRRSLAFKFTTGARQGIGVVDIETGQARVVLDEATGTNFETSVILGEPTWSPDGRAVLVTRWTDKQGQDLRLIPVAGGEVQRIPLGAELTRLSTSVSAQVRPSLVNVAWSPDGAVLAFGLFSSQIEDLLLENPVAVAATASGAQK
jgi:Tol biopolymer transport system component